MITLQSMMLVALGVLLAFLAMLVIAPAYRRRVERLTTDRIKQSIPITEAEIRADKDRLRAQYAIRVHKLEAQGEQQKLAAARQQIEMSRRDARITDLATELEKHKAALEENVNARRVLEHTVTDRLPRLEQQLEAARSMISDRDQTMASLRQETTRSVRALDEAMQMNAQQRSEIERTSLALSSRVPLLRETQGDSRFDGEIALRSEIEALRAKTRDQAQLIARLQSAAGAGSLGAALDGSDVDRLRRELEAAETALKSARDAAQSGSYDRAAAEAQAAALNAKIDEQAAELARLTAGLASYENGADADAGLRTPARSDTRLQSKARISSLQAQIASQTDTIQKLRAELASSNERLARQAAHFMDEMRRLGAGTVPTSLEPRRQRDDGPRRGLADRIGAGTRPADGAAGPVPLAARRAGGAAGANRGPTSAKVAEYIKALTDDAPVPPALGAEGGGAGGGGTGGGDATTSNPTLATTLPHGRDRPVVKGDQPAAEAPDGAGGSEPKRKLKLLERISGVGKG